MFKIYANGNFINECLGYGNAREIAIKTKYLFGEKSVVTIEDIKSRILDKI